MRLCVNLQLLQVRIYHFLAAVGALPQHTELISFISLDPPTVLHSVCRYLLSPLFIPYPTDPLFLLEYTTYSVNFGRDDDFVQRRARNPSASPRNIMELSKTYNTCRLWCLNRQSIRLNWCSRSVLIAFTMLALDL
jgi:hypothetical protein